VWLSVAGAVQSVLAGGNAGVGVVNEEIVNYLFLGVLFGDG